MGPHRATRCNLTEKPAAVHCKAGSTGRARATRVTPIHSALTEAPYIRDDLLTKWMRCYAADLL